MNSIFRKTCLIVLILNAFANNVFAQSLYFPPNSGNTWDTISPQSLNWCKHRIDSLYNYLEVNNSRAFLLLKDGKIVLEKYFGNHTINTPWQWASAGKTITALLVGIAQQENKLKITDKSANFLGKGWTSCTAVQEDKITVWNQLTMTSGLDDTSVDPFCTVDTCLKFKAEAGTRWAYHNGPYTLLDGVIEKATGNTLNDYTTSKLKNPTGMSGAFVKVGFNNVYFSNARSMARFGLLILNKGTWNTTKVLNDSQYFEQMVNTSQSLNKSYGYLWWLNGKESFMVPGLQIKFNEWLFPDAPEGTIAALGKDGQVLNIEPKSNIIWIRMGQSPDGVPVPFLMNNEIWKYINQLDCESTRLSAPWAEDGHLKIYPNPSENNVSFKSILPIERLLIYDSKGSLIESYAPHSEVFNIDLSLFPAGIYLVKSELENGTVIMKKLIHR